MTALPQSRRHALRSPDGGFAVVVDESGARIASIVDTSTGTEFLLQIDGRVSETPESAPVEDSNHRWHERYAGGWHALLPNAGDPRIVDGVEHSFHGEAAWARWRAVEEGPSRCTLEVDLTTLPLTLSRRTEATRTGVRVRQRVANSSGQDVAVTWTEHPAFGDALIDPRTEVFVDGRRVDIRFPETGEQYGGFRTVPSGGGARAEIRSPRWHAELTWDPILFPHLHVWQEHHYTSGFPWWGQTSTIALEPASRLYHQVTPALGPIVIPAGEAISATFTLDIRTVIERGVPSRSTRRNVDTRQSEPAT